MSSADADSRRQRVLRYSITAIRSVLARARRRRYARRCPGRAGSCRRSCGARSRASMRPRRRLSTGDLQAELDAGRSPRRSPRKLLVNTLGPLARLQDVVVYGRHRAVVEVRAVAQMPSSGGRLVAASAQAVIALAAGTVLLGEPALEVMLHPRRGEGGGQRRIGADRRPGRSACWDNGRPGRRSPWHRAQVRSKIDLSLRGQRPDRSGTGTSGGSRSSR